MLKTNKSTALIGRWIFITSILLLWASESIAQTNVPRKSQQLSMRFTGTWEEHWPDVPEHATHIIQFLDNHYVVKGSSPLTKSYDIKDVHLEGDILKFKEGTATFVVEYELKVKDDNTLQLRSKGRRGWREDIEWKRIK